MTVDVLISNKLKNGYIQIDVKNQKNAEPRHYMVHQNYCNKFKKNIKEHHKKMNTILNITIGASAFVGVLGASLFTKKFSSKITQWIINSMSALALIGISGHLVSNYETQKHNELLNSCHAKEINIYG